MFFLTLFQLSNFHSLIGVRSIVSSGPILDLAVNGALTGFLRKRQQRERGRGRECVRERGGERDREETGKGSKSLGVYCFRLAFQVLDNLALVR